MSNREVIEWLKKKAETVPMPGARKMYQAAIKALEAQKYMISRQAVIDELMTWDGHCITDAEQWHLRQVIGSIKSIPGEGENDSSGCRGDRETNKNPHDRKEHISDRHPKEA